MDRAKVGHRSWQRKRPFAVLEPGWSEPSGAEEYAIYALVDPRDDTVRYIGYSSNPTKRLGQHLEGKTTNRRFVRWLDELHQYRWGCVPRLVILEHVPRNMWDEAERRWIAYYRERGNLLNVADGGRAKPDFLLTKDDRKKKKERVRFRDRLAKQRKVRARAERAARIQAAKDAGAAVETRSFVRLPPGR